MGNLCCTETPDITMSCGNNNSNASCCKWSYTVYDKDNPLGGDHLYQWQIIIYGKKYKNMYCDYLFTSYRNCRRHAQPHVAQYLNEVDTKSISLFIHECDPQSGEATSLKYEKEWKWMKPLK